MNACKTIVLIIVLSFGLAQAQGIIEETVEPRPMDPVVSELRTNQISDTASTSSDNRVQNQLSAIELMADSDTMNWNKAILMELRGMRQLLGNLNNNGDYISSNQPQNTAQKLSPETQAQLDSVARQERVRDSLESAKLDAAQNEQLNQMSQEELFARAFGGRAPQRKKELILQLYVAGSYLEDVKVKYSDDFQSFRVVSNKLEGELDSMMVSQQAGLIQYTPKGVSSENLAAAGLNVVLDEPEFRLSIDIPSEYRKLQTHTLRNRRLMPSGIELEPAFFSGFLNLSAQQRFGYYEQFYDSDSIERLANNLYDNARPEREDWQIRADGAVNAGGWVLEGKGVVTEKRHAGGWLDSLPSKTRRDEFRLVKGFQAQDFRLKFGDISTSMPDHPGASESILGLHLSRSDRLFRRNLNGVSEDAVVEFFLKKPAVVDVIVNGVKRRSMNLGVGTHQINGFRGSQGLNQVQILINYQDGEEEIIPFSFTQAATELTPIGRFNWDVAGGVLRNRNPHGYSYEFSADSAMAKAMVRYGFLHNLEGLALAQGSASRQMAGGGLVWKPDTNRTLELQSAFSGSQTSSWDVWSELIYTREFFPMLLEVSGRYMGSLFYDRVFPSAIPEQRRKKYGFSAKLGSRLWRGSLNLYASTDLIEYAWKTPETEINSVDYRYGVSYGLGLPAGFNASLDSWFAVTDGNRDPGLSATVSWFFNSGSHSFYALEQVNRNLGYNPSELRWETKTGFEGEERDTLVLTDGYYEHEWKSTTSAGWTWSNAAGMVDGTSLGAGLGVQSFSSNGRVSAIHTMNRGVFLGNYSMSQNQTGNIQTRSHNAFLNMETSLMFAGSQFAMGRNVRNGFLLFNGVQDLNGVTIRANPSEQYNSEFARSGPWMSGAYTELGEYSTDYLNFKLVDPPPGTWLMEDRFYVRSGYKQGYAVKLGKPMRVLVRFRVIDETGQPVRRMVFQAFEEGKPKEILAEGFTSSTGYIQLGELMPGKTYMVRFAETSYLNDIKVEIPDDARGIYTLPPFKTEHQKLTRNP